jgi:hypothetical protein
MQYQTPIQCQILSQFRQINNTEKTAFRPSHRNPAEDKRNNEDVYRRAKPEIEFNAFSQQREY